MVMSPPNAVIFPVSPLSIYQDCPVNIRRKSLGEYNMEWRWYCHGGSWFLHAYLLFITSLFNYFIEFRSVSFKLTVTIYLSVLEFLPKPWESIQRCFDVFLSLVCVCLLTSFSMFQI